jgi:FixJ family two-component response regulator
LDFQLPGLNGLELYRELMARGNRLPVIFISGHADIPTSVEAIKTGAVDFLVKPFTEAALLSAVEVALERGRREAAFHAELARIRVLLSTLTEREAEVLSYIVAGWLNKQIACQLGISRQTVKIHRGRLMKKLKAQSVAELVQLAVKVGLPLPPATWHQRPDVPA